jgi:sulfonate transport system ATP-binding protein
MSDAQAIKVDVTRKTFPPVGGRDAQTVLRDIRFDVEPRSFVVITGTSGCGKSTLLNIVAGLDTDFEGQIDLGPAAERMTYVFQSPRLLPWRTVRQNIELAMPDGDPRAAKIDEMLERVGLAEAANQYPERISLGMQRRVALARGFILEPEILLMDEPFVSLDDDTARNLRALLMELWHRQPTTVMFVTHDRAEAIQLGTRIIRLAPGQSGVVQDLPITLSAAERADRQAVAAMQNRIFQ